MNYLFMLSDVTCGDITIDSMVPSFTALLVSIIKIAIPIILIAFGMIDLAKAVMANDDKVMKEATSKLIKRIVYALLIFFVVAIVQFVFGTLGRANSSEGTKAKSCIDCFINGVSHCGGGSASAAN